MCKTIDLLYSGNIACDIPASGFEIVGRLYQMEHQLLEWECTLPAHLSLRQSQDIPPEEKADECERFRVLLTLRYHNLRILIHRPVLVKFLEIAGSSTADAQEIMILQQMGSNSVQRCVQSSMEIISIVNLIVHSLGIRRRFLGAWWFSLYYSMYCASSHVVYPSFLPLSSSDTAVKLSMPPSSYLPAHSFAKRQT